MVGGRTVKEFDGQSVSRTHARSKQALTPCFVKRLKEPGRYCDGLGFWLQVSERHGRKEGLAVPIQASGSGPSDGPWRAPYSLARGSERASKDGASDSARRRRPIEVKRKKRDEAEPRLPSRYCSRMLPSASSSCTKAPGRTRKHREQWKSTLKTRLPDTRERVRSRRSTARSSPRRWSRYGLKSQRPPGG